MSLSSPNPNLFFAIWHTRRFTPSWSVVATRYLASFIPAFVSVVILSASPQTAGTPTLSSMRRQLSISVSITTTFSPLFARRCASVHPTPPPPIINISIGITLSAFAIGLARRPVSITVAIIHKNTRPMIVSPAVASTCASSIAKYVAIDAGTTPLGPIAAMNVLSRNRSCECVVDAKTAIGLTTKMMAAITKTPFTPISRMLSNFSIAARSMKITDSRMVERSLLNS